MDPLDRYTRSSSRSPVTFVMAYAIPTLGMERSALRLIKEIGQTRPTRLVIVQGPAPDLGPHVDIEVLSSEDTPRLIALKRLVSLARREPIGTFVLVGVWTAVPWLMSSRSRHRSVVWEHSLIREKISTAPRLAVLARLAQYTYRHARHTVAVSAPLADDIRARLGRPVTVIPNIVDEQRDTRSRDTRTSTKPLELICVGALTRTKRQETALNAVAISADTVLHIVGDGPMRPSLEAHAMELGIADRVHFHGHVSKDCVLEMMSRCDALVHPSAGETFGLVFVEAAAAGIPVIANRTRVSAEMIPRYVPGLLFDDSAESLAELLSSTPFVPLPDEVENARRRRLRDFSAGPVVQEWDTILATLDHAD